MYVPHVGAFIQRDPISVGSASLVHSDDRITALFSKKKKRRFRHAWVASGSLYEYVNSRPLVLVDPLGLAGVPTCTLSSAVTFVDAKGKCHHTCNYKCTCPPPKWGPPVEVFPSFETFSIVHCGDKLSILIAQNKAAADCPNDDDDDDGPGNVPTPVPSPPPIVPIPAPFPAIPVKPPVVTPAKPPVTTKPIYTPIPTGSPISILIAPICIFFPEVCGPEWEGA